MLKRYRYLIIGTIIVSIIICVTVYQNRNEQIISLGIYSGNAWGVPQIDVYKIYDEAIEDFEKEHPNIRIEYRSGTLMEDYSEWLAQQILSGNEPDVFIVLEEDFSTFASIGMLENLENKIKEDPSIHKSEFYEKAWNAGQYDGKQYCIPMQVVPTFMIMNTTLLENNEIQKPHSDWSVKELYDISKRITQDNNQDGYLDQFGLQGYRWEHIYYGLGEQFNKGNSVRKLYNEDTLASAIDQMKAFHQLNEGEIVNTTDFDQGQVAFKTFSLAEFRAYKPYPYRVKKYLDFNWEAIPFPKIDDYSSASKLYSVQLGMSKRSKDKESAWQFLKYLVNDERVQKNVWKYTYAMPSKPQVVEEIYAEGNEEETVLDALFLETIIESSVVDPSYKEFNKIKKLMDIRVDLGIYQDENTQDIIRDIRSGVNEIISEIH